MRKLIIFFLFVFCQDLIFSQASIKIIETKKDDYPLVENMIYVFDNNGFPIYNISKSDFVIRDNGLNVQNIIDFTPNTSVIDTLKSLLITFDLALNINNSNFDRAKFILDKFLDKVKLKEIALTSFDIRTYLNRDFTDTISYIKNEINNFKPSIGSSINVAFENEPAYIFKILNKAKYEKNVLLITDGRDIKNYNSFIQYCLNNKIKIFALILEREISNSLKNLIVNTGGYYIDKINENSIINQIINIIRAKIYNLLPNKILWESNYTCLDDHHIEILIPNLSLKDSLIEIFSNQGKGILQAEPRYIGFSSVEVGKSKKLSLTIVAKNKDIKIEKLKIGEPFKIVEGDVKNFILPKDQFLNVTIEYTPTYEAIVYSELEVISDACEYTPVYITGGYPNTKPIEKTIKITHPNGGEVLIVGDTSFVSWLGLLPKDVIQLDYSIDNGKTWKTLKKNTNGLKVNWIVPNDISDSCLVRIIQLWPNNVGVTLDLKHQNQIECAFFNKEGDLIITASADTTAIVWIANTGQPKFILRGHTQPLTWAQFDPQERYVITSSKDSTIRIWSLEDGSLVKTLTEHTNRVESVSWCHGGNYIVSTDFGGEVIIWDTNWVVQKKIKSNYGPTWFACFNPAKPELLATANLGGKIKVWNWKTYKLGDKESIVYDTKAINCTHVTYNSDGTKIAGATSSAEPKKVFVWDTNNPDNPIYSITHNSDTSSNASINFSSFFYHPDLKKELILTSSTDETARLWDASDGSIVPLNEYIVDNIFREHRNSVKTAVFDRFGTRVLTASWDSTAKIWNLNQKELQQDLSDSVFKIDYAISEIKDIDFGEIPFHYIKDTIVKNVFINKSNFPYKIYDIYLLGNNKDFRILTDYKLPIIIEPNDSINIELQFEPTDYGLRSTELIFKIPSGIKTAKVSGLCFEQSIYPNNKVVDFGKIRLGYLKDTTFSAIATNVKNSLIEIDTILILGSYKDDFSINIGDKIKSLNSKSDLLLSLRFNPKNIGRKNAQLYIYYKDKGNPTIINLYGESISSKLDTVTIKIQNAIGKPGDNIKIPIYLSSNLDYLENLNLEGFVTYLKFNSTLLEPIGIFEEDVTNGYDRTIKINLPKIPISDSTLKIIDFKVGLGNDTITSLEIKNSYPIGQAYLKILEESGKFSLESLCIDDNGVRLFDPLNKLVLEQNNPNPATKTTKLSFELFENGSTQLYILDFLGEIVKELLNKNMLTGKYDLEIDVSDLSIGNYYIILKTESSILYRKFQVIK